MKTDTSEGVHEFTVPVDMPAVNNSPVAYSPHSEVSHFCNTFPLEPARQDHELQDECADTEVPAHNRECSPQDLPKGSPVVLYLFSGPRRDNDLEHMMARQGIRVDCYDLEQSADHDPMGDTVWDRIVISIRS